MDYSPSVSARCNNSDARHAIRLNARQAIRLILSVIILLSFGAFSFLFVGDQGGQETPFQQMVIVGLWLLLTGCTFLPGASRVRLDIGGLLWPLVLVCYITVSPLWSDSQDAALKAAAFLTCSFGVWRLASCLSVEDFFDVLTLSLFALMGISLVTILVYPGFGITHDWQHEGDWQGIFDQKQGLGVCAAYFTILTLIKVLNRCSWWNLASFMLGLIMLFGSGSRGAAAIAAVALLLVTTRRSPRLLSKLSSVIILIEVALASMLILYFVYTGNSYLEIAGYELDFTERSLIWSYALGLWPSHAVFGYGINGFWTDPLTLWGFQRVYGWVLDNFHNGYIAILVETGVVGTALFLIIVGKLCYRIWHTSLTEPGKMSLGWLLMTFTINFTETTFFRSTNFGQIAFSFVMVTILATATVVESTTPRWASWAHQRTPLVRIGNGSI